MKDKGVYFSEADLERQIYFKDETILSEVGHFHDSVEFVFLLEGEIEARHLAEVQHLRAGEIFLWEVSNIIVTRNARRIYVPWCWY